MWKTNAIVWKRHGGHCSSLTGFTVVGMVTSLRPSEMTPGANIQWQKGEQGFSRLVMVVETATGWLCERHNFIKAGTRKF